MSSFIRVAALAAFSLALAAPAAPASASEALARKYACTACHQIDRKLVGPSFKDIAAKYADGSVDAKQLAARIKAGGSGKWGAIPMPAQAQVQPADLDALAAWILATK
jgi:cytochrome c